MKRTSLYLIKQPWFWAGIIFIIATLALIFSYFGGTIYLNREYTQKYGGNRIVFQKDGNAVVYTMSKDTIPCFYGIEGDTLTISSTPAYDRGGVPYHETFKIKNKMQMISSEGISYGIDTLQIIYIGQAMGISGLIFIASGIDAIKKHIIVEKDSREAISFTCQLNFIADNNKILIGKGLAHSMPMVGDTTTNYRFVIFQSKPSKFNSDVDIDTYTIQDMPEVDINENLKAVYYKSVEALTNGVGYGIIDADNRLCIYVDGEIKAGEQTKPIYLQFRGGI